MSLPPPYTAWAAQNSAAQNADAASVRIFSFLFDITAFSHNVDIEAITSTTSLLNKTERSELLHLAKIVARARIQVHAQ
jgi:hypothetical protein